MELICGKRIDESSVASKMCIRDRVCAYSPYIDPVAHPVWSCAGLAFPAFLIVNLLFLVFWLRCV